jgi:hypothetical protein
LKLVQKTLKGTMPVYVVDAERDRHIVDLFKVTGFPEIFVLGKDRMARKYKGPRHARGIVAFARHYA